MSRRLKAPMRELTVEERSELEKLSRASSAPAAWVIRSKLLLAVADGATYTEAAHAVGRKSGDAVSQLVERFNVEGLQAIEPRHRGGPAVLSWPNCTSVRNFGLKEDRVQCQPLFRSTERKVRYASSGVEYYQA